jgi:hypothetical protein
MKHSSITFLKDEMAGETQWSYFRDMDRLGLMKKVVIKSIAWNWGSYILDAAFPLRETSKVGWGGRRIKVLDKSSSGESSAKTLGATLILCVSLIVLFAFSLKIEPSTINAIPRTTICDSHNLPLDVHYHIKRYQSRGLFPK